MTTKEIKIEGMSCNHCVMAVKKELSKIENIKIQDVQIGSAKIEYDENSINENMLEAAVEEAGYKVVK